MVSCRPHSHFDTASYAKPLRFQVYLATFLNVTQKHFEKKCPLGNSTGTFQGQNSKMAKTAETAVTAGPRAAIFEISKFCSQECIYSPKTTPGWPGWSNRPVTAIYCKNPIFGPYRLLSSENPTCSVWASE